MRIKRYGVISLLLLLTLIITSCTQSPRLTLKDVSVDIVTMEGLSGIDDGDGVVLFDTESLHYKFILENTGTKAIGTLEKPIWLAIEHDTDLIPEIAKTSGRGYYSGAPIIAANETREFIINYDLGVKDTKGFHEVKSLPEQKILDEIESKALDAVLIIFEVPRHGDWRGDVGNLPEDAEELIRFDLREYKK